MFLVDLVFNDQVISTFSHVLSGKAHTTNQQLCYLLDESNLAGRIVHVCV